MLRRIWAAIALLSACLGAAAAQDQNAVAIFPQVGQVSPILSIALAPDGKVLASGGADNTIVLWDVASGREIRVLRGHTGDIHSVAFSPDGKVLASASSDKTIKLWNATSGGEIGTLNGHTNEVYSVAFSPDGKVLASGSLDHTIKLWDATSGGQLGSLTGHTANVLCVAFSPDGRMLASGSADKTVKLWDLINGRELRTLSGHTNGVASVAFSPDGKLVASGSLDRTVILWELGGGHQLLGHTQAVFSLAFSPDGKVLFSASFDCTIKLWDVASGREARTIAGRADWIESIVYSPDGKVLAAASDDQTVKLWDVASGRQTRTLLGHTSGVIAVAISPDGTILASGDADHFIKLWDPSTGRELRTLSGHTSGIWSLAFSPDGKTLASGSTDKTVRLWDVASGQELQTLRRHTNDVVSVAFSPDGKMLASASYDKTIKLWDVASGRDLRTLTGHTNYVYSVAFSPDGNMLASGSTDTTIKLWDISGARELRTLTGNTVFVNAVAFSPDGKKLASGSADGTAREWDVLSGKQRVALVGFHDGSSLALTPEGFFDSSSIAAEDNLNVRIGDRVFGIASYREKFYRPDLVRLSMAGGSLAAFGNIGNEKLPPIVELAELPQTTSEPKLNVTLRLIDGGGGIGLVRVFLNGSAIVQDSTAASPGRPDTRSYAVPLLDGPNTLRAVAFNADGSVQSNSVTASIEAHLPPAPRGTLHAVVIGIQDFPKRPQNNLTYSVTDAQLFVDTLKKYSTPLFEKLDVKLLTTAAETDKDHVVQALTAMQSAVGPDDEFVFYVASHGLVTGGEYYLITSNVSAGDAAHLKSEAISRQQLAGLLANIRALKKLVIIDTCHAEPVGDAMEQAIQTGGMTDKTATTILSRGIGLTVLAAATTDQEALEGYKDHGLFTRVLADGLSGQAAVNGIVSNFSLADYVGAKVPPLAANIYQHGQTPTVSNNGQRFPIAQAK